MTDQRDEEPEPVICRNPQGQWQAGRYIGAISMRGETLVIRPRFGVDVVATWLAEALNLRMISAAASHERSEAFLAWLLAAVWCWRLDQAARHGLPSMRREERYTGLFSRGRIDLAGTLRERSRGSPKLTSIYQPRDLDNAVSRTLVLAERALAHYLRPHEWRTPRVREVMPQLRAAVGAQPRLPSKRTLDRVRYTPITLPFKRVADLSHRIAKRRGFVSGPESDELDALLIDVAELWELFVLNCARRVFGHGRVEHGTREHTATYLLRSRDRQAELGQIKPDVVVREAAQVSLVIDAKYKHLVSNRFRRSGVEREDLYQLASYLSRYQEADGMLAYPLDPERPEMSPAEARGPWHTQAGQTVRFTRLPLVAEHCEARLQETTGPDQAVGRPRLARL